MTLRRSVARTGALTSRSGAAARVRVRFMLVIAGAIFALAAGAAVHAPTASACSATSHCYGIASSVDGNGFAGGSVYDRTNCINLASGAEFVTNELWAVTSNGARWIEGGIGKGAQLGTGGLQYFWGRNDPNLNPSFMSWNLGAAPANTYEPVTLELSSGQWYVFNDGVWNHTSAVTTPVSTLQAGIETNSNNTSSWGSESSMERMENGGSWVDGWGPFLLTQQTNTRVQWVNQYDWIQMGAGSITC